MPSLNTTISTSSFLALTVLSASAKPELEDRHLGNLFGGLLGSRSSHHSFTPLAWKPY
jgi:hypothetical protein